ncbi:MAG: DUF3780 domain-containing protein [Caldilineaceae bacterium]|nr:DUF3780 domain-containing protein [Caldilineaceae bacterium]
MNTKSRETTKGELKNSFGFAPAESMHHFLVNIPRGATAEIHMSEHFTWDAEYGSSEPSLGSARDGQVRVILARPKWDALADEVRAEFNRRLRQLGHKPGPGRWASIGCAAIWARNW